MLWWQSVLIIPTDGQCQSKFYFFKPLRGSEEQTEYCSHPLLFFSPPVAQTCTFLLYRGRIDVFVVIYLQNYYNLSSPGMMEPALLVNSQNIYPGSDLMQCKSEQCHWCQLSCSRMELLWNQVLPVNYSRSITFVWSLVWGREILCWTERCWVCSELHISVNAFRATQNHSHPFFKVGCLALGLTGFPPTGGASGWIFFRKRHWKQADLLTHPKQT